MSKFILDTRLSAAHYVLCTEAIRQGVITPSDLNEGRRTMPEQWHFWNNQPPLAAFPSPNAPHIKLGRPNHDLDVNSFNGAAQRLADFYRRHGVSCNFCVGGENWHICIHSASELRAAAKKIRKSRDLQLSKVGEREPRINFFKFQLHYIKTPNGGRYFGPERPDEGYGDLFTRELSDAVKHFQRDRGLKPDGVIGPATDRKIDKVFAKQKRKRKAAKLRAQERKAKVERGEEL